MTQFYIMAEIINHATVALGAYATTDGTHVDNNRDAPLDGNINDDLHSSCPANTTYTIHLSRATPINKVVVRLYYRDGRIFTFLAFETSEDGVNWTEVLAPGTNRSQTFSETFPTRIVSKIRMRGRSNINDHLHIVRFQAFNIGVEGNVLM